MYACHYMINAIRMPAGKWKSTALYDAFRGYKNLLSIIVLHFDTCIGAKRIWKCHVACPHAVWREARAVYAIEFACFSPRQVLACELQLLSCWTEHYTRRKVWLYGCKTDYCSDDG